jgi:hypothetical protein
MTPEQETELLKKVADQLKDKGNLFPAMTQSARDMLKNVVFMGTPLDQDTSLTKPDPEANETID